MDDRSPNRERSEYRGKGEVGIVVLLLRLLESLRLEGIDVR